jgi:outer membrane receptor protein involved in Fe transport
VNLQNDYWLPTVLATWNFADDLQLRLGYSHTIARPQFRELARSEFFDPETDRTYRGNPGLVDSELRNYDARLEYYMSRNAFVTLSGFYKEIESPIEEIIFGTESSSTNQTTFLNSPRATLWGSEFEFRRSWDFPFDIAWFRDRSWLTAFNYTYTKSEVHADPGDLVFDGISGDFRDATLYGLDGTPLQGTPEHIVNVQTGWQSDADEFTVLLGWVDERVLQRGSASTTAAIPAVVEEPGVQLDLTYRRFFNLGGRDMTLTLSGRNLLGEEHVEYQSSETLGRTDYNTYARGETFSVSLSSRF